ncbi:MAG: glycosyltransferase, partial [Candidatus Kariarchaeaceae archaeon]
MISDHRRGDQPIAALLGLGPAALNQAKEFKQRQFQYGALEQFGMKRKRSLAQIKDIIDEFDPDLLHAHDLYNAVLASQFDLPWIYNDHEAWSFKTKATVPINSKLTFSYWKRYVGLRFRKRYVVKWERKLLKGLVTLAVSSNLAKFHDELGAHSFTINNFPMFDEIKDLKLEDKEEGSIAYIGMDISYFSGLFRDTRGFIEAATSQGNHLVIIGDSNLKTHGNITNHGFVHHNEINKLLLPVQFGALAFRPHSLHIFGDNIKIYNYLHAGQMIIAPYTFELPEINHKRTYQTFSEIPKLINTPVKITPEEIMTEAREKFIWERQE